MQKKIRIIILSSFLILAAFFGSKIISENLYNADVVNTNQSLLASSTTVDIPSLDIKIVKDPTTGEDIFESKEFPSSIDPGNPILPYKDFEIALPQGVDENSIVLSFEDLVTNELPDQYKVKPSPPAKTSIEGQEKEYWGKDKQIVLDKNIEVYEKDKFYPDRKMEVLGSGSMRKWDMVTVRYYPYDYNPVTEKLRLDSATKIKISFNYKQMSSASMGDRIEDNVVKSVVDNYSDAVNFYKPTSSSQKLLSPADYPTYLIVTTSTIENNSTYLDDFVTYKKTRGFNVVTIDEADYGGGTGSVAANHIRDYLKNNYLSQNLWYVLFVGDPNPTSGDVPIKQIYPYEGYADGGANIPSYTDYFYADLTGSWDLNGNGKHGELADYGEDGIDLFPDIVTGRIPFYGSYTDLDSILKKTVDYESGALGSDWINKVMLSTYPLDAQTPAYQFGEQIKNDIAVPNGMSVTRLYDKNYNPPNPEKITSSANVLTEWQKKAGFHLWLTHGSSIAAANVFDSTQASSLNNSTPSFVFQGSCDNADPLYSGNLSYSLLKNGAISTLGATTAGFYWRGETDFTNSDSIGSIGYKYAENLISLHAPSGIAHLLAMLEVNAWIWPNHLVYVLYGDPSVAYYKPELTKPATPVVTDEGKFTDKTDQIYSYWDQDYDSTILEYQYQILEDSSTGTVLRDWTTVENNTDVLATGQGIDLVEGKSYYVAVRARNVSDVWSDPGYSDGILVDKTPPRAEWNYLRDFTYKQSIILSGTKNSYTTSVKLNSEQAVINGDSWSLGVALPAMGRNVVNMVATDNSGHETDPFDITILRFKPADANNDGSVGAKDFSSLMANWNRQGSMLLADLNEDGKVDGKDFSNLMAFWGK